MDTQKTADWLQIVGNTGIVLGLVFVGIQLYQDRQLKAAEFAWELRNSWIQTELATLGEEPCKAIVRSARDPENLTDEEAYILARLYEIGIKDAYRMMDLEIMRIWGEGWRDRRAFADYVGTELGHQVIENAIRDTKEPRIAQYLRDQLANQDKGHFARWFNEVAGKPSDVH